MLNRYITPDEVRQFLTNPEGSDDFDLCDASDALLARLDALEEDPEAYGFAFVVEEDEHVGAEGQRMYYYTWRLPAELLPDGFTSAVYIVGHGDEASEEESIVRLRGLIIDADGKETDSESEAAVEFETCAEVVDWLNTQLGGAIIKRQERSARHA